MATPPDFSTVLPTAHRGRLEGLVGYIDGVVAEATSALPVNAGDPQYGGLVSDGSTDNAATFTAAVAEARSRGTHVAVGPGDFAYNGNPFVLDWDGAGVVGTPRATIFRQLSTTAHGIQFGTGGILRGLLLSGFRLIGPGMESGATGVGIEAAGTNVKSKLRIEAVDVEQFGSHGIRTQFTDYLRGDQVLIINNGGDGWNSGAADNAATWTGSAFGISEGVTPPAGASGVVLAGGSGINFVGCEFGSHEVGYTITPDTSTSEVQFIGCRWERHDKFGVIGDAAGPTWPGPIVHRECRFMAPAGDTATSKIDVYGVSIMRAENCSGAQLASGAVLFKQQGSNAKVSAVNCTVNGGANVAQTSTSVNHNTRYINLGGDPTSIPQPPYMLNLSGRATTSATVTYPLGLINRNLRVLSAHMAVSTDVPNTADVWEVTLTRRGTAGQDFGDIATHTSASGSGWESMRRIGMSLGAQTILTPNETVTVTLTKTGTPVDVEDLKVMLSYEPLA